MQESIFNQYEYIDFHTHKMRNQERDDIMEIISFHLGQDREYDYFTVGLHPWLTETTVTPEQKNQLNELLSRPNCMAMGEMGLDNLKGPDMDSQIEILRSQLTIAADFDLPVIIHCVRAFDQLIHVKKEFPSIKKWCVHGYGRHAILGQQLIDQGFYLSIMPTIPAAKYAELFEALPINRLFLETDSMPKVNIEDIYLQVATETGSEVSDICRQMNINLKEFFNR